MAYNCILEPLHAYMNKIIPFALMGLISLSACTDRTERSLKQTAPAVAPAPAPSTVSVPVPGSTDSNGKPKTVDIALNPEHGQPGHRCEIPVGAPLNSKPEDFKNNAAIQQAPAAMPQGGPRIETTIPAGGSSTSSTVKLNPPHGEPGHDCAVPVGQPLPAK